MKDVEVRLQLLKGRTAAPRTRGDSEFRPPCETGRGDRRPGVVPVTGQDGTRQYSLEQELASSLRIPRYVEVIIMPLRVFWCLFCFGLSFLRVEQTPNRNAISHHVFLVALAHVFCGRSMGIVCVLASVYFFL